MIFNTALMSLFGFIFWIIVARFYSEAEVGFSSAIISAMGLVSALSTLGLASALTRFMPRVKKPNELINTCLTICGPVSLVVAAIFLAGLDIWSPILGFVSGNLIFASAFMVFTLVTVLSQLVETTFVAKRRAEYILIKNLIFSVIKTVSPVIFVLFFHAFGIFASWGVALSISLFISIFVLLPKVLNDYKLKPTININLFNRLWRYSSSNYLTSLLSSAPSFVLPIIVINLLGPANNAYFYIAWMIAMFPFTIPTAVAGSLLVESSHFEERQVEFVKRSFIFTFLLLIPTIILFVFAGKWIMLAFGENYSIYSLNLLQILAISSLPLTFNRIYGSILRINYKLKELMIISGFVAVTWLTASYYTIPTIGIVGIGYAWLGIQVLLAGYTSIRIIFWTKWKNKQISDIAVNVDLIDS
jgi:O-antigen/teichoic acid export membrane protein